MTNDRISTMTMNEALLGLVVFLTCATVYFMWAAHEWKKIAKDWRRTSDRWKELADQNLQIASNFARKARAFIDTEVK